MVKELSVEEKNELRVAKEMDATMATAGWKIYTQLLAQALQGKRNALEQLPEITRDGMAQVLWSEAIKGSIIGIRLALEMPSGMLAQADQIRKSIGSSAGDDE